jgi:hypothetical protein
MEPAMEVSMKKQGLVLAMLAMALTFGLVFAGCGKKDSGGGSGGGGGGGGSAELGEIVELTKTAVDAAKALDSVSGKSGGKGGGATASKAEDFQYDLSADGKGVVIKGLNVGNVGTIKVPEKIEGYPVVEIASFGYGTSNVTSVTIPNSVTKLGGSLFSYMPITKITLPPGITEIPDSLFLKCKNLTTVTIPNGVTKIGEDAFLNSGLKEITIPDSVKTIGHEAFSYCSELSTVKLPSHLIEYPDSSNSYAATGSRAFVNCGKLSLATRKAIQDSGYTGEF